MGTAGQLNLEGLGLNPDKDTSLYSQNMILINNGICRKSWTDKALN